MKIKLRDMTLEQYKKLQNKHCYNPTTNCEKCIFNNVSCDCNVVECWIKNKDLYSDKFLDQEIEVEIEPILTKEEKEYLSAIIKPFKDSVIWIKKHNYLLTNQQFIHIALTDENFLLPLFKENEYYKGMILDKRYTLEELGL